MIPFPLARARLAAACPGRLAARVGATVAALAGASAATIASTLPPVVTPPVVTPPGTLTPFQPVGTNLAAQIKYFATAYPLLDRSKSCALNYAGTYNAVASADLNANRYPKVLFKIMINVDGANGPNGVPQRYVVTTTLQAAVTAAGCDIISDAPVNGKRRIVLDASNPILDIGYRIELDFASGMVDADTFTMVREDQEPRLLAGEVFIPEWVAQSKQLGCKRFMDWLETNGSNVTSWADRPKLTDAPYGRDGFGAPFELCIMAANVLGSDAWLNVSHAFALTDMPKLATLVKNMLRSDLRCRIEYSNEIWNFGFDVQSKYMTQQSPTTPNVSYQGWAWYGYRLAQIAAIFRTTFGDDPRLRMVIVPQTGRNGVIDDMVAGVRYAISQWATPGSATANTVYAAQFKAVSDLLDDYAITFYVQGGAANASGANKTTVKGWAAATDGSGIQALHNQIMTNASFAPSQPGDSVTGLTTGSDYIGFKNHAAIAQSLGLRMVAYEGGFHLNAIQAWLDADSGSGRPADPKQAAVTELFRAYSYSPLAKIAYDALLKGFRDAGGTLAVHLTDYGPGSKYGIWGAKIGLYSGDTPRSTSLVNNNATHTPAPALSATATTIGNYSQGSNPVTVIKPVGGVGQVTAAITAGALADGRALKRLRISGKLATIQNVAATITLTDEAGNTATVAIPQNVTAAPPSRMVGQVLLTIEEVADPGARNFTINGKDIWGLDPSGAIVRPTSASSYRDDNSGHHNQIVPVPELIDGADASFWTSPGLYEVNTIPVVLVFNPPVALLSLVFKSHQANRAPGKWHADISATIDGANPAARVVDINEADASNWSDAPLASSRSPRDRGFSVDRLLCCDRSAA